MNSNESGQAIALIKNLWSEWKPTDDQLDVFRSRLERLEYGQAIQAIRAAFAGPAGRYNKPQLQAIMEAVPSGQPRHGGLHDGHPGMYVQCISHETRPTMIGHFCTLYWPTDKAMPPERVILERMEAHRAEQQALYGGQWQLIREFQGRVSEGEMLRRRAELRPKQGKTPEPYRGVPVHETVRQAVADFMAGKPKRQGPA